MQCGTVKQLYKSAGCCGSPNTDMPIPDQHAKAIAHEVAWYPHIQDCEKARAILLGIDGVASVPDHLCEHAAMLKPVGGTDVPLCEASDAGNNPNFLVDGQAGNTNFPHGDFKVLATSGEVTHEAGSLLTGAMDGLGAYLIDADTVRVIYQSEAYGQILALYFGSNSESIPWHVNNFGASLTGSHIHFIDYDRAKLADFMSQNVPAAGMVKNSGELPQTAYNLKGELVGSRNTSGATRVGAHSSNVDVDGNYIVAEYIYRATTPPAKADWLMQSLCSAHLETKHQWGAGLGVEDDLFITNEEWISYAKLPASDSMIGLPVHVLNPTTGELFATSAFTLGGHEKIVEVNSGTRDFVAFMPSGYNGAFGGSYEGVVAQRNWNYTRSDGNSYVWPQNILPSRLYLGKKYTDKDGNTNSTDFLARNGFEFGALYGFATDCTAAGYQHRDAWHRNASKAGEQVVGAFYKMRWKDAPGEVKDFVHDGSWEYQDAPEGAPEGWCFWNGNGKDASASKTEHNSPDPRGGLRVLQSSTAGYFGIYEFSALTDLLAGGELPSSIPATYTCLQPESDIVDQVILSGKGQYADGQDARYMPDKGQNPGKSTFEDIDAVEWIAAKGGEDYIIIHEDGGNDFGERKFLAKVGTPIQYYFVAMSGGPENSRQKAGVSAVAGSFSNAASHEFSGATDLSGMLAKDGLGNFRLPAGDVSGLRRQLEAETAIDDKIFTVSLQAHSQWGGWTESVHSDATGQILVYRPDLSNARLL